MEVKSVIALLHKKWVIFNESHFLTKSGKTRTWHWIERVGNQSAVMIAAMHGEKLVLIREFRVPLNSYIWGLPAGLVETHESAEETGIREIMEETGLTLKRIIRPSIFDTRTSPGITNERLTMMFAEVEGAPTNIHVEDSEDIEVHLLDRKEVSIIFKRRELIDSKAALIMLRFVEDGKI